MLPSKSWSKSTENNRINLIATSERSQQELVTIQAVVSRHERVALE